MSAPEVKIGQVVIECGAVQMDNVGITPHVFGMARFAGRVGDGGITAMKARVMADILVYVLVAVAAQLVLGALAEAHVTSGALGFQPGMTLDHRAGHQQAFDVRGVRCIVGGEHHHGDKPASDPVGHGPFGFLCSVHVNGDDMNHP